MKDKICISVIIPFFNAKKHISNCLNSVFYQSFNKQIEVILIDDGSNDGTSDFIKKNVQQFIVFLFKQVKIVN